MTAGFNALSANYTIADPISDNCTGATWGYTLSGATTATVTGIADGSNATNVAFNIGVTTVTLTGTDGTNSATTCQFIVTVNANCTPGHYLGPNNGDWHEAANWCDGIPTISSASTIPDGINVIITTATAANAAGYDWWPALWIPPTPPATTGKGSSTSLKRYQAIANADGKWPSNVASRTTIGTLLNATDPAYMLFVRGDRTVTTGNGSTRLVPTGTLKTGAISQPVPATTTAKFFTYGNPYASAIDFEQLLAGNTGKIAPEMWIWNAGLNTWQTVKEITGIWTAVPGGADPGVQYVQSGQGVMLQTTSATATTLTTMETYKTSGLSPITPFEVPGGHAQPGLLFTDLHTKTTDGSLNLLDGVLAVFAQDNNRDITDAYDVAKMSSFDRDLGVSFRSRGALLSIEGRPLVSSAWDTLYLDIPGLSSGTFTLSFNAKNLAAQGAEIYLLDKHLLSTTALSNEGFSQYEFTVNSSASAMADRFSIVQRSGTVLPVTLLGIQAAQQQSNVLVSWQTASESNMSHYEVLYSRNGIDFGKARQIEAKNMGTANYQWLHVQPGAGNHFYKINAVDKEGGHLVSKVVKVTLGGMVPSFTVYPNPMDKGNQLTVQMEALPPGTYSLQVMDAAGRVLQAQTLPYAGGSAAQVIQLPNGLPPGKYFISLTGNGKQYLETVMKL